MVSSREVFCRLERRLRRHAARHPCRQASGSGVAAGKKDAMCGYLLVHELIVKSFKRFKRQECHLSHPSNHNPHFPVHIPHFCWPGEYPLVQTDSHRIHGVDLAIKRSLEVSMCAQTLLDEALPASFGP
jgi:hypothetical protein